MDWELAIEKNHEALKRILAMLVAMVGMTGAGGQFTFFPQEGSDASRNALAEKSKLSPAPTLNANADRLATLPRHLHRYVLRLLRPAEAATRRLIIIAAQGLTVALPKQRPRRPTPNKPPLNRKNGYGTGIVIRPGPLPEWAKALVPKRSPSLSLPLLDPLKRFGVRRRYANPSAMPQIRVLAAIRSSRCSASPSRRLHQRRLRTIRSMRLVSTAGSTPLAGRLRICRSKRNAWRAGRRGGMRDGQGKEVMRSMRSNRLWMMPPHRLALRARHLSPISWGRGMGAKLERGRGMGARLELRRSHRNSSPPRSGGEVARP